ncbi:PIN domain-containing protein [Candidatus Thiothrix sp. Deng01]|uniref:PIN domain-containing protein n=1 Tax=Candidatus Thiothrix phosphatis TaxID=3112415 RepID=A0ABU6CZI7_9GAMM|nr:PIN domain-containing protein [Candidatus Thiothrix sp. Deng01]MEB4592245.1 PIN domain-containing protein [Candidatus Thiothrix sp. Deng01]
MQLVDTNVILRYLLADNEALYQRACTILDPLQRGETQGTVTEGVLIECVYVLLKVYEIPRALIADKLSAMLSYTGLYQAQYDHHIQALEIFAEHNVDIVDALLFTRSQQEGSSIQSFDKDIRKLIKRLD